MLNLMVKNLSYAKINVWTLEIILDLCSLLHKFLKPIKLIQRSEHVCTCRNNLKINVPLTLTITNSICEQNFYTSALISFRLYTKCTDSGFSWQFPYTYHSLLQNIIFTHLPLLV